MAVLVSTTPSHADPRSGVKGEPPGMMDGRGVRRLDPLRPGRGHRLVALGALHWFILQDVTTRSSVYERKATMSDAGRSDPVAPGAVLELGRIDHAASKHVRLVHHREAVLGRFRSGVGIRTLASSVSQVGDAARLSSLGFENSTTFGAAGIPPESTSFHCDPPGSWRDFGDGSPVVRQRRRWLSPRRSRFRRQVHGRTRWDGHDPRVKLGEDPHWALGRDVHE